MVAVAEVVVVVGEGIGEVAHFEQFLQRALWRIDITWISPWIGAMVHTMPFL